MLLQTVFNSQVHKVTRAHYVIRISITPPMHVDTIDTIVKRFCTCRKIPWLPGCLFQGIHFSAARFLNSDCIM